MSHDYDRGPLWGQSTFDLSTPVVAPAQVNPPVVVYVAGPIDFLSEVTPAVAEAYLRQRRQVADQVIELVSPRCTAVAWQQGVTANVAALNAAQTVVALLPAGVPSIGVPIEIHQAASAGKPVIVLTESHSELLATYPTVIQRPTIERAISALVSILSDVDQVPPSATPAAVLRDLPVLLDSESPWAIPSRHYADDAGLDLYVAKETTILAGAWATIPCGIRLALPEGTFGLLIGRSSTHYKRGLQVQTAIIDEGWRGPMMASVFNPGENAITIHVGDRLAQLVILPNLTAQYQPVKVSELPDHPRGESGFGSTGIGPVQIAREVRGAAD